MTTEGERIAKVVCVGLPSEFELGVAAEIDTAITQAVAEALKMDSDSFEKRGHNQSCYYCGKVCNSLAGNPSLWPIVLCHKDEPGVPKYHHTGCVSKRLDNTETVVADALKPLVDAMTRYYVNYLADEAYDVECCPCGQEQHEAAVAVRNALADHKATKGKTV